MDRSEEMMKGDATGFTVRSGWRGEDGGVHDGGTRWWCVIEEGDLLVRGDEGGLHGEDVEVENSRRRRVGCVGEDGEGWRSVMDVARCGKFGKKVNNGTVKKKKEKFLFRFVFFLFHRERVMSDPSKNFFSSLYAQQRESY